MTGGKYALRRAALARKQRCAVVDPPRYDLPAPRCAAPTAGMVGGKHHLARALAERGRL